MSRPKPYHTGDLPSFARLTARDRWPIILTKIIDDVHRAISTTSDPDAQIDGKKVVAEVAKIKYECQHDRPLAPIVDDGSPHVESYNQELAALTQPSWCNAPFLFSECYHYRRLRTPFAMSSRWHNYDPFAKQKIDTFRSSRSAVLELAARYNKFAEEITSSRFNSGSAADIEMAERELFHEVCKICLWGNAADLSFSFDAAPGEMAKSQGAEANKAAEKNIIVNDLDKAFDYLLQAKRTMSPDTERRVDIVLDNAGFELYVDLVLAGYLLQSGLATTVVLHPKDIPWFVSDVTPKDFGDLLNVITNAKSFYGTASDDEKAEGKTPTPLTASEEQTLAKLAENWTNIYAEGSLIMRPHIFWTGPTGFSNMLTIAPDLYADLQTSRLVIFKGDLNYRKLTEDLEWPSTTPFTTALGPLGHPHSGLNVMTLRTCKSEVVVGLPEGLDQKLSEAEGDPEGLPAKSWRVSGKYAVVQFCQRS